MNAIEIFRTNVSDSNDASFIIAMLAQQQPGCMINFDLDDCDHILRIESISEKIDIQSVIEILNKNHFKCEVLN